MNTEEWILQTYPTVHPKENVKLIEERLREKNYLVVIDEKNKFHGVLTSLDILGGSNKLILDCLTHKEIIQTSDSLDTIADKFEKTPSEALAVFKHGKYRGIFEKTYAIRKLMSNAEKFEEESIISKKIKMAFLQNLSHEVRTPLNHILGFMSIIIDQTSSNIDINKEECYLIIQKSSELFLSTMTDLIELSQIYSGSKVDMNNDLTLVETIFTEIKAECERNRILSNIQLHINYINPDSSRIIQTDTKKLKQILCHLIHFTIKHIQKKGRIEYGYELLIEKQAIRFYIRRWELQSRNTSENGSSNIIYKNLNKDYTIHYKADFGVELAKKMIELLGGTLDFAEFEKNNQLIYFSIPMSVQDKNKNNRKQRGKIR